ncbi:MAG TPA: hypothetical protein VGK85_08695 [Myxococcaceae bacterium]
MADPTKPEEQNETIRRAPADGDPSTQPRTPPADDDRMERSAESGEGDIPEELPSNRAQERGRP